MKKIQSNNETKAMYDLMRAKFQYHNQSAYEILTHSGQC